jgi:hypothetical protein
VDGGANPCETQRSEILTLSYGSAAASRADIVDTSCSVSTHVEVERATWGKWPFVGHTTNKNTAGGPAALLTPSPGRAYSNRAL